MSCAWNSKLAVALASAMAGLLAVALIAGTAFAESHPRHKPRDKSADEDPLAAAEAYQQHLFETIAPSVIFISKGNSFGSGFFVDAHGLALTNRHVVGDATSVTVVLHDGKKLEAKVVERAHHQTDLALIQVPIKSSPALELSGFEHLRVGSWVGSISHGAGGIWTFTRGMVSNIYPSKTSRPIFQTQIPLNPGSSGGPVFDRKGRVVGVVTAGIADSNSVNFAIRSDVALSSLDHLAANCRCLTVHAPKGVPVFVDGKMVGKGPKVMLKVSHGAHDVFVVVKGKMKKKTAVYPKVKEVTLE